MGASVKNFASSYQLLITGSRGNQLLEDPSLCGSLLEDPTLCGSNVVPLIKCQKYYLVATNAVAAAYVLQAPYLIFHYRLSQATNRSLN